MEKKPRQRHPDRIVLSPEAVGVLRSHTDAIDAKFGGMIRLGLRDLANYLLIKRADALSESEIEDLKRNHYDEVKALRWAIAKLKQSKSNGDAASTADIFKMIQSHGAGKARPLQRQRRKREPKPEVAGPQNGVPMKLSDNPESTS